MALADIIERIEADATTEASAIEAVAAERAEAALTAARAKAQAESARVIAAAEHDSARDAETIVVNARLRGRDAFVAAQRALIDEVLVAAAQHIADMPEDEYARFLARRIAGVARGGETLSLGALDAPRAPAVTAALSELAPELELVASVSPAPFERGVLLAGERVRVDLSLPTIISDRADDLESVAAAVLFSEGA